MSWSICTEEGKRGLIVKTDGKFWNDEIGGVSAVSASEPWCNDR